MNYSTTAPSRANARTGIDEEFSLKNATSYGGANLYLDYLEAIGLQSKLQAEIPIEKAEYSTYELSKVCMLLITGYTLGKDRILQFEDLEGDPLLMKKFGLDKIPHYSLLYKDVGRFDTEEKVGSLKSVNGALLEQSLTNDVIMDFDSSVTTVYGNQQKADMGYNQNKPGRLSYHPFFCFDGKTKVCLNAELRQGTASNSPDFKDFYAGTKSLLPSGIDTSYARFDSGFGGEDVYRVLEKDNVGYVGKMKMTDRLRRHAAAHPFKRVEYTDLVVEVTSFNYQATTWNKRRRVVIVRTKDPNDDQLRLSDEYGWDYRVLITNLDWDCTDIWRFYNQRCTSENYIKEVKSGFGIGNYPTDDFYPNAADLLLKVISYNCFIAFKNDLCDEPLESLTVERMRRYFLRIPAVIRKHARRLLLKLDENFRFKDEYMNMRRRLETEAFV